MIHAFAPVSFRQSFWALAFFSEKKPLLSVVEQTEQTRFTANLSTGNKSHKASARNTLYSFDSIHRQGHHAVDQNPYTEPVWLRAPMLLLRALESRPNGRR